MAVVRLGCSVATRKERERERGSKTVKKRTCDEKRGDKRTRGVDTGRVTEGEEGKAKRMVAREERKGRRRSNEESRS